MKYVKYILVFGMLFTQFSCVNDPLEDIEEGNWNNERSILDIKFENQVGQAEVARIDESTGDVLVTINVSAVPDLSSIKIAQLQLSYGAESSVHVGDALNFENESNSSTMTVTSPTGISRNYTITADSFIETLVGTYDITGLILYGGTGPEYGGGAVLALTDKPWAWPADEGPGVEMDNALTFEMTGITDEGNTYGTFNNMSGDDGKYADFQFVLDPATDVNHFYRKLPEGEGEWSRNYATGRVTFTFSDGHTTSGKFEGAGTEDLGNGLSKTIMDQSLTFELNGTDDWDNIYSDYDKFVKRPRKFWIDIKKRD